MGPLSARSFQLVDAAQSGVVVRHQIGAPESVIALPGREQVDGERLASVFRATKMGRTTSTRLSRPIF